MRDTKLVVFLRYSVSPSINKGFIPESPVRNRMERTFSESTFRKFCSISLACPFFYGPVESLHKIRPEREWNNMWNIVITALIIIFSNYCVVYVWQEICGVAPRSNLKQCIRLLASRLESTSEFIALNLVMKDEV